MTTPQELADAFEDDYEEAILNLTGKQCGLIVTALRQTAAPADRIELELSEKFDGLIGDLLDAANDYENGTSPRIQIRRDDYHKAREKLLSEILAIRSPPPPLWVIEPITPQGMLELAHNYLANNAAESGADEIIRGLCAALRQAAAGREARELRELWGLLNGHTPRCRDCADHDGNCPMDGKPCDPHQRAVAEAKRLLALPAVAGEGRETAGLRDCLQSIADLPDTEPRETDDADWRFRCLEAKRAAECTLAAIPPPQGNSPIQHEAANEIDRLRLCISMAMGCIDPESKNSDERLAWHRLYDALQGREPRDALASQAQEPTK